MDTNLIGSPPSEILNTIDSLRSQVESLQRELSQALSVWLDTLEAERKQFDELLSHKEAAWEEQRNLWAKQTAGYEARLEEVKNDAEAKIRQLEDKASRELADLDEAWQQEKFKWVPAPTPAEAENLRAAYETKIKLLERRIADLEQAAAQPPVAPVPPSVQDPAMPAPQIESTLQALDEQIAQLDRILREAPDLELR